MGNSKWSKTFGHSIITDYSNPSHINYSNPSHIYFGKYPHGISLYWSYPDSTHLKIFYYEDSKEYALFKISSEDFYSSPPKPPVILFRNSDRFEIIKFADLWVQF